jgi:hypothetical protein
MQDMDRMLERARKEHEQWRKKHQASKNAPVGMPESEADFWANALITMVGSGELEMDCDAGKARVNPHTWAAGGRQGQERLACAIWLTCGVAGTKRVVIYDGQSGRKFASYDQSGFKGY